MSEERISRWMLGAAVLALGAGGVLRLADADVASNAAWALAGVAPLTRLLAGIVRDLRRGRPGVDVIAVLAVAGALALEEYLTAGVIGLMLATGRYLEARATGRAERELTALVEHAPRVAHRLQDGELHTVDVGEVEPGDRLMIKSGELVPVDGVVARGPALLDEAALTGESLPVERPDGDRVSSGAVNAAGSFELRAVATAAESTYAGIVRLVEEARTSRAPVVRLADRWAGWFVPLALAVAGIAWLVSGDAIRALAVLVVATPCPLLLAVPIAIVSGVSRAARRGVIVRGGAHLETLARTRNLMLDKTGTLTVGEPTLRSITTFAAGTSEEQVLRLAASVELASTHLLARAIVAEAHRRELDVPFPSGVIEEPGAGVAGIVDGQRVAVGNASWLLADRPETPLVADFRRHMVRVAPLSVFISIDEEIVAAATFDDSIRPDAAATIRGLRRAGVRRVVMATGDHPVVADSVGLALGVDVVLAECTPQEKVDALHELRTEGTTAMVGDGINDAPALAAADVGVAMGARGATASSEAADVVLVVDRLRRLMDGIVIAQRSRSVAFQSALIGMGLSFAAMGAAALGLLPPLAGAITQEVVDVIAIANALRALTGSVPAEAGGRLPPELSARLRAEHDSLMPRLDRIGTAADELDRVPPQVALAELEEIRALLADEILPHEAEDERAIYPLVAGLLGGEDPLAAMSRSHREIFHLADVYRRVLSDLPEEGPEPSDLRDLRRLLYSLHAVLRLHFDQEEELYSSLDDDYATVAGGDDRSARKLAGSG